jgi:hypothetical protein
MPAWVAVRKNSSKNFGPHRHVVGHPLHADRLAVAVEVFWSQFSCD